MNDTRSTCRRWLSAADIARLPVSGMPKSKRQVNHWAKRENWSLRVGRDGRPLCRKRHGRGGGLEYHYSILPFPAVEHIISRIDFNHEHIGDGLDCLPISAHWLWFCAQSNDVKDAAWKRLRIVAAVDDLIVSGNTVGSAIFIASRAFDVSEAVIKGWRAATRGIRGPHRLPHIAPRIRSLYQRQCRDFISFALQQVPYSDRRLCLLDLLTEEISGSRL